jgi:hypothetical protein
MESQLPPDAELWGIRVLWWGRLGKLAQLLGALTIVIEIIGPTRLRSFGASLRTFRGVHSARRLLRNNLVWSRAFFQSIFRADEEDRDKDHRVMQAVSPFFDAAGLTLYCTIYAVTVIVFIVRHGWDLGVLIMGVIAGQLIGMLVAPAAVLLSAAFIFLVPATIDTLMFRPMAWLLEQSTLDKIAKVVGVLLILVGTHF